MDFRSGPSLFLSDRPTNFTRCRMHRDRHSVAPPAPVRSCSTVQKLSIRASRPAADRALFATLARRSRSPQTRSPPSATIASRRASWTGSTGPRCHEGQPLAHPAGWSPDMVASPGGRGSISLTSQRTGRSHRLKDCAAPPIFSHRPEGGRCQKIGSSACRLRRSLRDP